MVHVFKGFREQRGPGPPSPSSLAAQARAAEAPGAQGPGVRRSLDHLSSGPKPRLEKQASFSC